jgi:hypothetical protein
MQAKKKQLINLPVPLTSEVVDYAQFTSGGFVPPLAYIRRGILRETDDASAEYDLDWEDETWLAKHAKYGNGADEYARLSASTFQRMLGVLEVLSGPQQNAFVVPAAEAVAQLPDRMRRLKDAMGNESFPFPVGVPLSRLVEDVHKYWIDRRNKLKKPLMRRFWSPTSLTDLDPNHCFRVVEGSARLATRACTRKNDTESFNKLMLLSQELHGGLELTHMVCNRELMKRDQLAISQDLFEQVGARIHLRACVVSCSVVYECYGKFNPIDACPSSHGSPGAGSVRRSGHVGPGSPADVPQPARAGAGCSQGQAPTQRHRYLPAAPRTWPRGKFVSGRRR